MKRSGSLKRKPREAFGTAEQRFWFKSRVHAEDGGCVMVGRSLCHGSLQAAHVIPKQRLKREGYGPEVVYASDAAFTLCERHHNRHDNFLERVPDGLVPERCRRFAVAYGRPHDLSATRGAE